MKKLFTLLAVVLLSLCGSVTASAQTEVDIPINEGWGWGWSCDVSYADGVLTGTLTDGYGAISIGWNDGVDWSKYNKLCVVFESCTGDWGKVYFSTVDGAYNPEQSFSTIGSQQTVTLNFDPAQATAVKQLGIQGKAAGDVIKISRVYLVEALEYEKTGVSLAFDEWGQIPASAFLGYTENAKVVFTATVTGADGHAGWGNGKIESRDGKVVVSNLSVKGEGDNVYTFSLAELKEALLSGPDQYGNFGIIFTLWDVDNGACTSVRKSVEIFEVAGAVGEEITATVNDGESIGDAIGAAAPLGTKIGKLTINLQEGATVRLNSTLKISDDLTINGNGGVIDAWNVGSNAMILMTGGKTAAAAASPRRAPAELKDYIYIDNVVLKNLTIWNVKGSLLYDGNNKMCVENLTIENCKINFDTEAVDNEALVSFKAGGAKDVTIKNCTFKGNNAVAKYFIRYNNSARLDRYGYDKDTEFQTMTYLNNTFVNMLKSDGQWGNYNGISGQVYSKFDVQNNIWYNCGNDIIRRMAGGRFSGNNPMTFAKNTYFNGGEDKSTSEASYDKSGTILTTDPTFADAANDNFTIGASTQQAKYQTGDPRWLTAFAATDDVDVFAADGSDISALVFAEAPTAKAVNIYLTAGSSYTLSSPIEAFVKFIGVESGEQATIDASALTNAMIMLPKQAGVDANEQGFYALGDVTIQGVKITGVPKQVFWANQTKYLIPTFTVDNSVIALAASSANVFDTSRGGVIGNFVIKNSTIACPDGKNTGSLFSSQSGQKATEAGLEKQVFSFQNSTFYNIANGKNLITHRQAGQTWLNFELKNSIAVNSGKSGQFVIGMNQGQVSANPVWAISGNSFNFEGEEGLADTSAAEAEKAGQKEVEKEDGSKEKVDIVTENVEGVVNFVNPVEADFTLAYCSQLLAKIGDPRWIDNDLAAVADELAKELEAAVALLGDTDPASSTEATNLSKAIASAQTMLESATTNVQFYKEELAKLKEAAEAYKATLVVEEINVAKALEIIAGLADGAKTDVEYKVKGIVVGAPDFQRKSDGTLYGNVNLDIADEKGGETKLTVFRAKSYENEVFTEETISLIKENDEVVFQGKLQKYVKNETVTPELVSGWLISVTGGTDGISTVQTIQVDSEAVYNLSGQKVDASYKGVVIKGGKKFFQK
ncbi:MAG: DUF5123 domain-containing protein [Prevotella sp.]|jgi:hypothetical protein|nr:DUF5123 domain-containing protein [Prevotella sp.]